MSKYKKAIYYVKYLNPEIIDNAMFNLVNPELGHEKNAKKSCLEHQIHQQVPVHLTTMRRLLITAAHTYDNNFYAALRKSLLEQITVSKDEIEFTFKSGAKAWYNYSKSASRSGNKAIGNAVMKKKLLGVVVKTENVSLEISCDKNGVLS